jgi:hypothetical protein
MTVEFRSRWSCYITSIEIGEKTVEIVFEGMREGGSYFVTTDPKIAEELKRLCKTSNDMVFFNEETGETVKEEIIKEEKEFKQIEEVTNISEAREYLKKAGVDYRKLNSPNAVVKQGEEIGVKFPNLIK